MSSRLGYDDRHKGRSSFRDNNDPSCRRDGRQDVDYRSGGDSLYHKSDRPYDRASTYSSDRSRDGDRRRSRSPIGQYRSRRNSDRESHDSGSSRGRFSQHTATDRESTEISGSSFETLAFEIDLTFVRHAPFNVRTPHRPNPNRWPTPPGIHSLQDHQSVYPIDSVSEIRSESRDHAAKPRFRSQDDSAPYPRHHADEDQRSYKYARRE
ncbi:hypothetical protein BATDEDRAFT_87217 [Batrachochytrium dendrobatidis JAM81]|uniref:Uncharacterized protein n=1 Tax=Batrachochytrium dendrobatidis (strain JAM81 / FGSC 10211) TaxID=684364 RepID=F4NYF2_BATDJ|nr:uncharacterized protein BATDEDRAFT_87217 [Batrachochytrium dendrobatidis JAM81]EGF81707.1 hypothetical protein BATDEDRAFT_87217 [Batrachochytrium dendrobatidis JAM81]|eukprot:XP_006677501.1 hypothetical protein BATDEDRAFT_87217 [Batrachochytrium dendrobatidis JAM81]